MKERLDLCAHFPGSNGEKSYYRKVGSLFVATGSEADLLTGKPRYSIKLDLVPIGPEWQGWINAFPLKEEPHPEAEPRKARKATQVSFDDDVPF